MNKDIQPLFELCLRIADNNLIFGQRICEWCGHGPFLEEDIALSNIGLDMLGQANYFYKYIAELEGKGRTEDDIAFLRIENEYKNDTLAELPNGDYAFTMVKLYFFSEFQLLLYKLLLDCSDESVQAMAGKAIKETLYHVRHCRQWIVRFGDGTEESRRRLKEALSELWAFTGELFEQQTEEVESLDSFKIKPIKSLEKEWNKVILSTLEQDAKVEIPKDVFQRKNRLKGRHTEYMGYILTELQYMQRTYPNCKW